MDTRVFLALRGFTRLKTIVCAEVVIGKEWDKNTNIPIVKYVNIRYNEIELLRKRMLIQDEGEK